MTQAEDFGGILTGTGLQSYLEANRIEMLRQSDAFYAAAEVLNKGLRNYLAGKGMDNYRAGRVTKPLKHAGDLIENAAKMMGTTFALYNGLIIPRSSTAGSAVMEPDK